MNAILHSSHPYRHDVADTADDDLELAWRTRAPVLITAQGRDQRESLARLIHVSRNESGPFVGMMVDPGRAAANGSRGRRTRQGPGDDGVDVWQKYHEARGGTLFIDDITHLTGSAQAHVYCLLGELQRIADRSNIRVVRIIAGASRHLDADRLSGVFYDMLFYRLNVVHLDRLGEHHAHPQVRRAGQESDMTALRSAR